MGQAVEKPRSFQEIILRLQSYWASKGCAILQPYDMEVGAGTFHPATTLRALDRLRLGGPGLDLHPAQLLRRRRRHPDDRPKGNHDRSHHSVYLQILPRIRLLPIRRRVSEPPADGSRDLRQTR